MSELRKQAEEMDAAKLNEKPEEDEIEEEEEEDPPKDPPGYMNYEDWIAAGKDPDEFRGRKAYEAEYDRIQQVKELEATSKEMRSDLKTLVNQMGEWQTQREGELRAQLEGELKTAKEDDDVDGAIETQRKIDALNKTKQEHHQPREAVGQLVRANPLVDPQSEQFNKDFSDDFKGIYNSKIMQLSMNGQQDVNDGQIERAFNAAIRETKGLHPDLFESGRNNRATTTRPTRTPKKDVDPAAKVKDFKLDGSLNASHENAAWDTYEKMKAKYGEEAANRYAARLTS